MIKQLFLLVFLLLSSVSLHSQVYDKTTDDDLQVAIEYIEKLESITREELVALNNPMIYFILWLVKVYKEQ